MRRELKYVIALLTEMYASNKRKVHLSIFLLGLLALVVLPSACHRYTPVIPDAPKCSEFIPDEWWLKTPGTPLPADDTAGSWVAALNGQTGQLELANLKIVSIQHVIGVCEARFDEALAKARRLNRPWWRRL